MHDEISKFIVRDSITNPSQLVNSVLSSLHGSLGYSSVEVKSHPCLATMALALYRDIQS